MKAFLFLSFLITLQQVFCCCNLKAKQKIIITGDFLNNLRKLNGRHIYLVDLYKAVKRDSGIIQNGKFSFGIDPDSSFSPFLATIKYVDTAKGFAYLRPIAFLSPYYKNVFESSFYVELGTTEIKLDTTLIQANKNLQVVTPNRLSSPGTQNEPLFKHILLKKTKGKEEESLQFDQAIIKKYPESFYVLDQLYFSRDEFSIDNLTTLLNSFRKEIKKTNRFGFFSNYFAHKRAGGHFNPQENFALEEYNNHQPDFVLDKNATINPLVFWASWCAPCRREIPDLKKLFANYSSKGLAISSISIDENRTSWKNALKRENMPWKQFIVGDSSKDYIELKFNVHEIPKIF